MKIVHVVGARPNFMKIAPVWKAISTLTDWIQTLVHTGQHYDDNMSTIFFNELGLPKPHVNLEVGGGTHAYQTGQVMILFEALMLKDRPDWVLVYGDVNSTAAASMVCAKLGIKVAHVEAGLRSFDREMPEEINRLVTDQLADLLLTPSLDGNYNLIREGIHPDKIHFVGNVMIDTLIQLKPLSDQQWVTLSKDLNIEKKCFILVTLHRPSNVDDAAQLTLLLASLEELSSNIKIIFPLHPRTRNRLVSQGYDFKRSSLHFIEPLGYLAFLALQAHAKVVVTDSGGVQEETTYLGVPCLTMRENTERPVTVTVGTNKLIGRDVHLMLQECQLVLNGTYKKGQIPLYWDGKVGARIVQALQLS
ncbi:MAG: UDP-N-acetylglucosamine 2-epimerase (non-hydrolyzing) [Bacteroidetes Order II. Incertae sedis bacterium]|nr:UDP-N-acetylglucosamine 2-epimerase (non-hydrolyzing) [Bacteroidetes Order II. bacterium]